ncbi:MAG TPA: signal peptidase I [Streptosporangiaceae bacterium]
MPDDQTMDQPELTSAGQSDAEQPPPPEADQEPQPDAAPPPEPADRKKGGGFVRQTLAILVVAVVLTTLLKIFVVQVYVIPSPSMQNTLMVGDRILVNKLVYHFRGVDRGDIIVFSGAGTWGDLDGQPIAPLPGNPVERIWDEALAAIGLRADTTDYIKRVIGLPGDHVACCTDGNITVNRVQLNESSFIIPADIGINGDQAAGPASLRKFSITVPPGRLWVMGDNRSDSEDSMYRYTIMGDSLTQSTIPESQVAGRAFFIIWPLSQFGDLPIPAVFKQAAINATPAAAGVALATPVLIWQRRKRRRGQSPN